MTPPGFPIGVSALITHANKNEWLLVRGPEDNRWVLPGGSVELGEAPSAAIVRELHDKLGLIVFPKVRPEVISWSEPSSPDRPGTLSFVYVLGVPANTLITPRSDEIADWTWMDRRKLSHNLHEHLNDGEADRVFEWDTIGQVISGTLYLEQWRNGAVQA